MAPSVCHCVVLLYLTVPYFHSPKEPGCLRCRRNTDKEIAGSLAGNAAHFVLLVESPAFIENLNKLIMTGKELQHKINLILADRELQLILFDMDPTLTAEYGIAIEEEADHRINRLCYREGIPLFVVDGQPCYSPGEKMAMEAGMDYDYEYDC